MYLVINGNKHTVSRRIVKPDEIRYLTVTPAPEEVSGVIQMYEGSIELPEEVVKEAEGEVLEGAVTEEGSQEPEAELGHLDFLISEDNADEFLRWTYSGTLLVLTNKPESVPVPVPEPLEASTHDMANAIMEGVNEV